MRELQFKKGDRVWSMELDQWVIVCDPSPDDWPRDSFAAVDETGDGGRLVLKKHLAFFEEIAIPDSAYQRPRHDLKIDNRVIVRSTFPITWVRGYFTE